MNNCFASHIKTLRTALNITQTKLANELGTTQAALSAYENGDRIPSYEILVTLAQKYNVSIDWLCGFSNKMYRDENIATYADAFRVLVKLCSTKYKSENSEILLPSSYENGNYDMCFIVSEDQNFHNFFMEWKKIYDLYSEGTIDNELYDLWLEKHLKDYERPINHVPF